MAADGHAALEAALLDRFVEHCAGNYPEDENDSWAAAFVQGFPMAEVLRLGTFNLTILCAHCKAEYKCTEPDAEGDIQLQKKHEGVCLRCGTPWDLEWPEDGVLTGG